VAVESSVVIVVVVVVEVLVAGGSIANVVVEVVLVSRPDVKVVVVVVVGIAGLRETWCAATSSSFAVRTSTLVQDARKGLPVVRIFVMKIFGRLISNVFLVHLLIDVAVTRSENPSMG